MGYVEQLSVKKKTGSLHLHFWNYIQRAHQYKTLKEIAELLERAFIQADELKAFCENLCCECYPDVVTHAAKLEQLEQRWPRFHEHELDNRDGVVFWGANRIGRLAPFIWQDRGTD